MTDRKTAMRALAREIGKMSQEQRSAMAARFPGIATIEGRSLSPFNTCLLATQSPSASVVGGFRQWIKAGRAVRKGEHGLCLWVPLMPRKAGDARAEGETDTRPGFILGTVFDVSQTSEIEAAA